MGLGVPGGERQAPARADGGVTGTDLAPLTEKSVTNRSVWAVYGLFFGSVPPVGRESPARRPGGLRPDALRHDADRRGPRTPAAQTPSSDRGSSDPLAPSPSARRGAQPPLHAALRRHRGGHDAGGDLIVSRSRVPSEPSGSPRRSRASACACRSPRPAIRGHWARRASSCTACRACRRWGCSRERPKRRCAGPGGLVYWSRVPGARVRRRGGS